MPPSRKGLLTARRCPALLFSAPRVVPALPLHGLARPLHDRTSGSDAGAGSHCLHPDHGHFGQSGPLDRSGPLRRGCGALAAVALHRGPDGRCRPECRSLACARRKTAVTASAEGVRPNRRNLREGEPLRPDRSQGLSSFQAPFRAAAAPWQCGTPRWSSSPAASRGSPAGAG